MPALHLLATVRDIPLPGNILRRLLRLHDKARSRRHLSRLDDRLLRDIGLTRDQAKAEMQRPLWDAPSHWRG